MQSTNNYYLEKQKKNFFVRLFGWMGKSTFKVAQGIVLFFTVLIILYLFVISPHIVDGISMQPTFCNNDIYIALKQGSYDRGDVIVFKHDETNDFIKRVVGIAGDTIRVENGEVFRNNELLKEVYLPKGRETLINPGDQLAEGENYIVPEGKYFVLGDNRPNSTDSRNFLAIDPVVNTIKGKVFVNVWPFSRAGIFDTETVRPESECGEGE